jgi:hypothetical protein
MWRPPGWTYNDVPQLPPAESSEVLESPALFRDAGLTRRQAVVLVFYFQDVLLGAPEPEMPYARSLAVASLLAGEDLPPPGTRGLTVFEVINKETKPYALDDAAGEMQWPGMCEAVLAIDPAAWRSAPTLAAAGEVTAEVTFRVTVEGTANEKRPTTLEVVGGELEREKGFEPSTSPWQKPGRGPEWPVLAGGSDVTKRLGVSRVRSTRASVRADSRSRRFGEPPHTACSRTHGRVRPPSTRKRISRRPKPTAPPTAASS